MILLIVPMFLKLYNCVYGDAGMFKLGFVINKA